MWSLSSPAAPRVGSADKAAREVGKAAQDKAGKVDKAARP
jgi:hypothetical protein